jgi:hypothetical protein
MNFAKKKNTCQVILLIINDESRAVGCHIRAKLPAVRF